MTDKQCALINIKAFFITVAAVLALVPLINLYIDPSGIFFNRARIIAPAASANWTPMRHIIEGKEKCHAFAFGTSRMLTWDTNELPNKPCKIMYPGKGMQSFLRGIKTLIKHNIKLNTVYITVERGAFYNQKRFGYKQSSAQSLDYPSNYNEIIFAYKTLLYANTFSNIKKILEKPTIYQYPAWDKFFREPNAVLFRHLIFRWESDLGHIKWKSNQERVNAIYNLPPYASVTAYRDYKPETIAKIIKEINFLAQKHNFKVIYIRAPIFVKNIVATDKNEFFDAYKLLANLTPFYDFSYDIKYSNNPSLWIDSVHYNKSVATLVTDNLGRNNSEMTFGAYITKDNINAHITQFEENVHTNFLNKKPYPPNTEINKSWLKNQTN